MENVEGHVAYYRVLRWKYEHIFLQVLLFYVIYDLYSFATDLIK